MSATFEKMEFEVGSSTEAIYLGSDNQLVPDKISSGQKLFKQQQFTALIKQLSLSKDKKYFLASRLKEGDLLFKGRSNFYDEIPSHT